LMLASKRLANQMGVSTPCVRPNMVWSNVSNARNFPFCSWNTTFTE
jgi:hypothetical protein